MTGIPTPPAAAGPAARAVPRIDIYGHAECCLCRTAMAVLERLRGELGFRLVEHDITADEELHRAYFERVPVICLDGEELFDYRLEEAVLRARLDDLESRR